MFMVSPIPGANLRLRGVTSDRSRGAYAMLALSDAFDQSHAGLSIAWDASSLPEFEEGSLKALAEQSDIRAIVGDAAAGRGLMRLDGLGPTAVLVQLPKLHSSV